MNKIILTERLLDFYKKRLILSKSVGVDARDATMARLVLKNTIWHKNFTDSPTKENLFLLVNQITESQILKWLEKPQALNIIWTINYLSKQ